MTVSKYKSFSVFKDSTAFSGTIDPERVDKPK